MAAPSTQAKQFGVTNAVSTGAAHSRLYLTSLPLTVDPLEGNLTEANLTGADLTGADLTRTCLTGADLTGAHLNCANLDGAELAKADLTYADLTGATGWDRVAGSRAIIGLDTARGVPTDQFPLHRVPRSRRCKHPPDALRRLEVLRAICNRRARRASRSYRPSHRPHPKRPTRELLLRRNKQSNFAVRAA